MFRRVVPAGSTFRSGVPRTSVEASRRSSVATRQSPWCRWLRHSISVTNWLRQMRYPPMGAVAENHSLYPRVILLPNRPCFPINTKHFRRSSVTAEKKFERVLLLRVPTCARPRKPQARVVSGNRPLKPTVAWWRPIPFPVEFPSGRATARRNLARSQFYRSPPVTIATASGDCTWSQNGKCHL